MNLKVDLIVSAGKRPAPGTPVWVQLRDTSLADAPAVVLAEARGVVQPGTAPLVASVELKTDALPPGTTVWARVAGSGDMQRTQVGDYITMASYPVTGADRALAVEVKQVS